MGDDTDGATGLTTADYTAAFQAARAAVKARVRLVTPKLAADWLTRNPRNRPLSEKFATRYAAEMKVGRWEMNGQPVVLDTDGNLIDGQHRLRAVVLTGMAVPMLVVEGVHPGTFQTIDQGRKRSLAQYLQLDGEHRANTLAGSLAWLNALTDGCGQPRPSSRRTTIADLYAVLAAHPEIRQSVAYVRPLAARGLFEPSPFSAVHYLTARAHGVKFAQEFFDKLFTGVGLAKNDPVYNLREQIHRPGPRRLSPVHKLALTIKAVNATAANRPLRFLKWSEAEDFPQIV